MKTCPSRSNAFTLVELILVVAVLGLLATLFVHAQVDVQATARRHRINCLSNLKQVGLAFRMFSGDHAEKFPWAVQAADGGTLDGTNIQANPCHFRAISNELSSPKILACLADDRRPAVHFLTLTATNISYFAGLDANEALPQTILSGDRNVTNGIAPNKGIIELTDTSPADWTETMHNFAGNIGLGDGSAQQVTTLSLRKQITAANATLKTGKTRLQLPLAERTP